MGAPKIELGGGPLTDPRALSSSLAFHVLLLAVASVAAVGLALPRTEDLPNVIHAELGPVDNRAPAVAGGGGPGPLGGDSPVESVALTAERNAAETRPKDPGEAVLSDVLPAAPSSDVSPRALPGPQTSGMGVLPGPGTGGGGGSGGGSGGGRGRGVGPGTEFFGARERAGSFAYVIDCSGSMANRDALGVAKRELLASLSQLPPDAEFAVVFYNLNPTVFDDAQGREGLMPATAQNKARVRTRLAAIAPDGGTDHMSALRTAIGLQPEVIFFLTDADLISRDDVETIRRLAGQTRIQAVEFGIGPDLGTSVPLRSLATSTGGTYRYFDVTTFRAKR